MFDQPLENLRAMAQAIHRGADVRTYGRRRKRIRVRGEFARKLSRDARMRSTTERRFRD
jgi:hypothetical protein